MPPPATYIDLCAVPPPSTAELIDGRLIVQQQPKARHQAGVSALNLELGLRYRKGRGGPGGWWIIEEPEVHFIRDIVVTVPDLAGWTRPRMPKLPDDHRFEVITDWICEVLSPSTSVTDRTIKLPLYAQHGVAWIWLLDPDTEILETYTLLNGAWRLDRTFGPADEVSAAPFLEANFTVASIFT